MGSDLGPHTERSQKARITGRTNQYTISLVITDNYHFFTMDGNNIGNKLAALTEVNHLLFVVLYSFHIILYCIISYGSVHCSVERSRCPLVLYRYHCEYKQGFSKFLMSMFGSIPHYLFQILQCLLSIKMKL